MTKAEAIKAMTRTSKESIRIAKNLRYLDERKFDGYIKGVTDSIRIACNIIKKIK